ncbi:hypothetical protein AB4Y90_18025 [Chryseobacterium sp. 2TAF14]|uniref:hypothetical protein n=1 Tax=Chryseobacterium sp. 2TAF14 TaxID=3233007 RepID=UPI003F901D05
MDQILKKLMKNRNYFFFFIVVILVLLNCHTKSANAYKIVYIDHKQYLNILKDSTSIKQDISLKKKFETKQGVIIKTELKDISFQNKVSVDDDTDGYEKYEYQYYIKNRDKYLVKFTYFEGDYYLLIDNLTSKIDTLDSKPLIVNDNLLTIYQDMEDADQFSTLKLYNFDSKNNLQLIDVKKEKWILDKVILLKNNTLAILVSSIGDDKKKYGIISF